MIACIQNFLKFSSGITGISEMGFQRDRIEVVLLISWVTAYFTTCKRTGWYLKQKIFQCYSFVTTLIGGCFFVKGLLVSHCLVF